MRPSERMSDKRSLIIIVLAILVVALAVVLVIVLTGDAPVENKLPDTELSEQTDKTDQSEQSEQSGQTGSINVYEDVDSMTVSTALGALKYPEQWSEYLTTYTDTNNGVITVIFATNVGETEYELFRIFIGGTEGTEVGVIRDADGKEHTVRLAFNELEGMDELSDTDRTRVYAMQEDLNYVIDNLE